MGRRSQNKTLNVDVRQGPRRPPGAVKAKKPTHGAGFFAFYVLEVHNKTLCSAAPRKYVRYDS